MYRVILASSNTDAVTKLADKISDFLESQCNYARQHSFLLHEMSTKSFTRKLNGKSYVFKLSKGVFTANCEGEKIGSINLSQGFSSKDAIALAKKVSKHSMK